MNIKCWFGFHKYETHTDEENKILEKCSRCNEMKVIYLDEGDDE